MESDRLLSFPAVKAKQPIEIKTVHLGKRPQFPRGENEAWHYSLTVACVKTNRLHIAENAVKIAEKRIARDKWPEYYDTKGARFIWEFGIV